MAGPLKLLLAMVATGLLVIGIAAQTGTIHLPRSLHSGSGAVQAEQAHTSPPVSPPPASQPPPAGKKHKS